MKSSQRVQPNFTINHLRKIRGKPVKSSRIQFLTNLANITLVIEYYDLKLYFYAQYENCKNWF